MRGMMPMPAVKRVLPTKLSLRSVPLPNGERLAVRPLLPENDVAVVQTIHGDGNTCLLSRGGAPGPEGAMGREEAERLTELWSQPNVFGAILSILPTNWSSEFRLHQWLEQEQVVGMIALTVPPRREPSNFGLALALKYQGKGYGTAALRWMLEQGFSSPSLSDFGVRCEDDDGFARLGGIKEVRGESALANPRARACWKKIGFKEVEEREGKVFVSITRDAWETRN